MNRGISEGYETLAQEYLTRQIQFCVDEFCLVVIWNVIFKKGSKMNFTKILETDLDSPCRDLSNGGLGIFLALLVCWGVIFSCACTGAQI